ncbi:hypothetical protein SAMN04487949_1391 [Halogranum gelatinilyticum]|uniref:Uncharacterized protein n=1 Tax=Halogranum gelatinilyticum TaxID=660521 RepID=A0A1G9SJF8_9EURY|nr:hypothetical protein [Halogranum gelatinilyticum]SDM35638.1 hypothetical protein SAMN04487949_1391 [Halogranum gelatinilyticum]
MGEATATLVATVRTFGGEALRDVWLFDQWTHQKLYARDDVEDRLDNLDVTSFIDNERYGYITRDTYESLYYADYDYTVRGFSSFELFRTFLTDDDARVGVLASFDRTEGGYDFGTLSAEVQAILDEYPVSEFTPVDE